MKQIIIKQGNLKVVQQKDGNFVVYRKYISSQFYKVVGVFNSLFNSLDFMDKEAK